MDVVWYFVGKLQDNWDEYLLQFVDVIRLFVNRNIGFILNQFMFGCEVNLLVDLVFCLMNKNEDKSIDDYFIRF